MSDNGSATILSLTSWEIYIPIGYRYPFMRYWQPLGARTTATLSQPHPENQRQQSINSFISCIFGIEGITWMFVHISESFTALRGKNTIYQWKNMDSKLINITNCKTCKNMLLVVENTILIRYYQQTAKTRALCESVDGPAGQPADNPPNSDRLGVYHQIVPEVMGWDY